MTLSIKVTKEPMGTLAMYPIAPILFKLSVADVVDHIRHEWPSRTK